MQFRVRVSLDEADPPIWRRLELAGGLTLAELHEVLQTAMGWTDSHLHQFELGPERDPLIQPFRTDGDEEDDDGEGVHERDVHLDQVIAAPGDRLFYEYDFGDAWGHTIEVESISPYDDGPQANLIDGDRACPPEDCGGIPGLAEIVAVLADPEPSERALELFDWLPGDYDPAAFSLTDTQEALRVTLASLGGLAGVRDRLELLGTGFAPGLQELIDRSGRAHAGLAHLIVAAELTDLTLPEPDALARMVRPWLYLLDQVGTDGLQLTQAGWLPPALVSKMAIDLDLLERWMGKGNREEHFQPVALTRSSATRMGLLRKAKGRLLRTRTGQQVAGDPTAMWRHVADSLPIGAKDWERHAGVVMLLALAAGQPPQDGNRVFGPTLLWDAGWAVDGQRPNDGHTLEWARPTWEVLRVAGCVREATWSDTVTDDRRRLARAALRSGG